MKIYLDVCAIQRPLDTFDQIRIVLEAEAVLGILSLFERGILELLSSDALVFETEQNPFPLRREHARAVLSKAREHLSLSPEAIQRAKQLTIWVSNLWMHCTWHWRKQEKTIISAPAMTGYCENQNKLSYRSKSFHR